MTSIEVFADVSCPFTHVGLRRLVERRQALGANKAIRVLNRQTLEILTSIGGHAGHNAREFFHIHGVAIDSKGNLFLGEVNNGQRYYKYAFKGMGPAPAIASAR